MFVGGLGRGLFEDIGHLLVERRQRRSLADQFLDAAGSHLRAIEGWAGGVGGGERQAECQEQGAVAKVHGAILWHW
ncbi:hypothetical protein D3C76_1278930 [compost metagenome]